MTRRAVRRLPCIQAQGKEICSWDIWSRGLVEGVQGTSPAGVWGVPNYQPPASRLPLLHLVEALIQGADLRLQAGHCLYDLTEGIWTDPLCRIGYAFKSCLLDILPGLVLDLPLFVLALPLLVLVLPLFVLLVLFELVLLGKLKLLECSLLAEESCQVTKPQLAEGRIRIQFRFRPVS